MVSTEQLTARAAPLRDVAWRTALPERAARESLRAQVAKLERELSGIVAAGFPHIVADPAVSPATAAAPGGRAAGPRLLSLEELEVLRDGLVVRVRAAQRQAARRAEVVRRSREQLERMRAQPGHYKFVRLPVTDLGEHGCGVWEVRPRLGLLGMLAGWWELRLSSGCPLPRPRACGARPLLPPGGTVPRASRARAGPARGTARRRAGATARPVPAGRSPAERHLPLAAG